MIVLNRKIAVKYSRRIKKSISVHNTITNKVRIMKCRNKRKHSLLFGKFKISLKSYKIVHIAGFVFFSELKNRPRSVTCLWIHKTDRFHRSKAKCSLTSLCHYLNRHTALIHLRIADIAIMQRCSFCRYECIVEGFIFLLVHRTVDIIVTVALIVS